MTYTIQQKLHFNQENISFFLTFYYLTNFLTTNGTREMKEKYTTTAQNKEKSKEG